MNDMQLSLECDLSLYADDSALLAYGKDLEQLSEFLSNQLSQCNRWLVDNRLSLHLGKTEVIVFGSRKRLKNVTEFNVKCGDTMIKRVTSVKYLGVILDEVLSFRDFVGGVLKRAGGKLSFLYRQSKLLSSHYRRILCSALIQPHLDYCSAAWFAGLNKGLRVKMSVLQRKMVRFILNLGPRDHVGQGEIFRLSWITVPDRARYFRLCHVHKVVINRSPDYISENFKRVSDVHSHCTRGNGTDFFIPGFLSTTMMKGSFLYNAITDWNALPMNLKGIPSEAVFRRRIKAYLMTPDN